MIMTSNTYFEGYRELTDHFKIDPAVAMEALGVASQFCSAQICPECTEGGCRDCKGRQKHEYQLNCGKFDNTEISEIIQEIVSDADYISATKESLMKEMEDLESKMTSNIEIVPDEVFEIFDNLNIKLEEMEEILEKTASSIEIVNRLHNLEENFRHRVSNNEKPKGVNIPEPIQERKTFQAEYEDSIHSIHDKERKNLYGDHSSQLWG